MDVLACHWLPATSTSASAALDDILAESQPASPHTTTRQLRYRPGTIPARSQSEHTRRLRPLRLGRSRQIRVDSMLLGKLDGYVACILDEQLQCSLKGVPR